jgi:hypothetical protein
MNFLAPLYPLAHAALFKLDPETAHDVTLHSLKKLEKAHLAGLSGSASSRHTEFIRWY